MNCFRIVYDAMIIRNFLEIITKKALDQILLLFITDIKKVFKPGSLYVAFILVNQSFVNCM